MNSRGIKMKAMHVRIFGRRSSRPLRCDVWGSKKWSRLQRSSKTQMEISNLDPSWLEYYKLPWDIPWKSVTFLCGSWIATSLRAFWSNLMRQLARETLVYWMKSWVSWCTIKEARHVFWGREKVLFRSVNCPHLDRSPFLKSQARFPATCCCHFPKVFSLFQKSTPRSNQ